MGQFITLAKVRYLKKELDDHLASCVAACLNSIGTDDWADVAELVDPGMRSDQPGRFQLPRPQRQTTIRWQADE